MTVPAQVNDGRPGAVLPQRRTGHTTAVRIGGEQFYLTANAAADGTLGEVFIQWGKHGPGPAALVDLYASALSVALQGRVPLADLIQEGLGLRFAPAGHTDDPDIPVAHSVADYVARRLALDWLPPAERAELGVRTRAEHRPGHIHNPFDKTSPPPALPHSRQPQVDGGKVVNL